jgi:hypothetical protein
VDFLIGGNELECGIMDVGTELELEEIKDSDEYLAELELEESEIGFGRTRQPSELKVVSEEAKGKTVS